ncbi:MAG TPA: M50 family metallopeptidase [Candidatus Angelobacter sp.]|nr:M50 family metallopeptidase [Candidatus Angelobacter sp.]
MGHVIPGNFTLATYLLFILCMLAAGFLAITVHESGHAVVGELAGFHVNSLRVGRLQLDRPFRISLYRGRGTGAGGWVSLFPVKHDKLVLRATLMLLAGPFASLASAGLLIALPYSKGMFSAWFICISLLIGVMNLVPFRHRAVISDGGRVRMLLQNRASGERWLAMLKLLDEIRQGVPQENLSSEFLAKAVAIQDNSPDTFTAHAIAYSAAFWQHKNDEAGQMLETCLRYSSVVSPTQRHAIMIDAAVFQGRRRKRIDLAEQWLADVPQKTEYPWFRLRGEAAILEAKGDITGALTKLDEVIKLVQATPNQAMREISLRGVSRWKAELLPIQMETVSSKSLI